MDELYKQHFIKLTHFLGEVLGPQYEIVFHIIEEDGAYIAAIANNHISGRTVDSPLTTFASEMVQKKDFLEKDYVCDYKAFVNKTKALRGSTFFIKKNQELLGILCINHDTTEMKNTISKIIELERIDMDFLHIITPKAPNTPKSSSQTHTSNIENLSLSIEEILAESIDLNYLQSGYSLSVQQKDEIIQKLFNKGVFNIKGSISAISQLLNISEPSIYRYLKKFKK